MKWSSEHNAVSPDRRMRYGLQAKALLAPTVLIALMTLAFVTVFLSSERQSTTLTKTFEYAMVKNATVADVRTKTVNIHSEMYRIMSLLAAKVDSNQLEKIGKEITENITQTNTILENLKKESQLSSIEKSQIERVIVALITYDLSTKDALNAQFSGLQIAAIFMVGVEQNFKLLQKELVKLDEIVSVVQYGDTLENSKSVQKFVIFLLAIAAILGVLLTRMTMRHVTGPIADITESMKLLAAGNTEVEINPLDRKDEIGDMARALAVFKANAIELKDELVARKEAELAMKKAMEQAEHANQAKSEFLSMMSHEIRTPLNGMLGMTQLILGTDLNSDQRAKAETIIASGQSLQGIINDVLDMSKIESGKVDLENVNFEFNALLSSITSPFQHIAKEQGIKFQVKSNINELGSINGDPTRVRQILLNLVSNAMKFSEDGRVIVSLNKEKTPCEKVSVESEHVIRLDVIDNGVGIPPERLKNIFKPFIQADVSTTRQFGGTGLGLTIVKRLLEIMGGSIEIESELGIGTHFTVFMPFGKAQIIETEIVSQTDGLSQFINISQTNKDWITSGILPPLSILVAEDNYLNCTIAREFLQNNGHRVTIAHNGIEAVEAVSRGTYDLLFMDFRMPEMDGVEATKFIRKTMTKNQLPIVGLTAEAFSDRHVQFKAVGMNGILTKPYTEEQMIDALKLYAIYTPVKGSKKEKFKTEQKESKSNITELLIKKRVINDRNYSNIPIGDMDNLKILEQAIGLEITCGFLEQACEDILLMMADIRSGQELNDSEMILKAAQAIKGTSSTIFGQRLIQIALEIEDCSNDFEEVKKLIPELEITAEMTFNWWREYGKREQKKHC